MRKKYVSVVLVAALIFTTASASVVKADTSADATTQDYIVVAKNDLGYEKVEDAYDVNEEMPVELTENNILLVEMTEREAEQLEKDKNIFLVEEDITLEGSEYEEEEDSDLDIQAQHALKMQEKAERDAKSGISAKEQWNIDVINANSEEYKGVDNRVKVAILDSGVTASDDLNIAGRINFIPGDEDVEPLYEDVSGHGTSVASVIVAKDNGMGITGVNPNAELYSLRVLDDFKKAPLSRIVDAIYWCIEHDIDIINMSFGTTVQSAVLENAVNDAEDAGILMIAAAGNHGGSTGVTEYPAAFDSVIAVGATAPDGQISDMSSIGTEVEILAPGEKVPATGYFDEIVRTDGTSMAAPHVTGIASVLLAKDNKKSAAFIRTLLTASARKVDDNSQYGLVDLNYALSVYDEFAANYDETAANQDVIVHENTMPVEIYDDAEVEALWYISDHQSAIDESGGTSASVLAIMKHAQKIVDTKDFLDSKVDSQACFHGSNNYIANYMFLMRIAKKTYNNGLTYALNNTSYPYANNESEAVIRDRLQILNANFTAILNEENITDNNHNRGRFIVGLAIHVAMDAYAHKAYYPSGDSWILIPRGSKLRDDKEFIRSRYTIAKKVASDIIYVWHNGITADALEFYQESHSASAFHMHRFYYFVNKADPDTIAIHPQWYKNRSSGD